MAARRAETLREQPERQINISIPGPINARLDALVELANRAGENTSRKELAAALLLSAPEDGMQLVDRVRSYRQADAREAVVQGYDESFFLSPSPPRPGPRRRRR